VIQIRFTSAARTKVFLAVLLSACLLPLVFSRPALADGATYTYQGPAFNPSEFSGSYGCTNGVGECAISGSFTVGAALGDNLSDAVITPTSFSFTDGNSTWTNANNSFTDVEVWTDATGNITSWYVEGDYNGPDPSGSGNIIDYNIGSCSIADLSTVSASSASGGCNAGDWSQTIDPDGNTINWGQSDANGTWTDAPVATPEAATLPMVAIGLLIVLAAAVWHRRQGPAEA